MVHTFWTKPNKKRSPNFTFAIFLQLSLWKERIPGYINWISYIVNWIDRRPSIEIVYSSTIPYFSVRVVRPLRFVLFWGCHRWMLSFHPYFVGLLGTRLFKENGFFSMNFGKGEYQCERNDGIIFKIRFNSRNGCHHIIS